MKKEVEELYKDQLTHWALAKDNYRALAESKTRFLSLSDKFDYLLQYNPSRIFSATAKVDAESLSKRPCFLCKDNLYKEQKGLRISDKFTLFINPFPILPRHLTIINNCHTPQLIAPYWEDFLIISKKMGQYFTVFYNGAQCGASAPDHMHFQAGHSVNFIIWKYLINNKLELITEYKQVTVKAFESHIFGICISGSSAPEVYSTLIKIMDILAKIQPKEQEPMLNIVGTYKKQWNVVIYPRENHRPRQYFAKGNKHILLSPGTLDFVGMSAVPREEDFEKITPADMLDIFHQLRLNELDFAKLKEEIASKIN